MRVEKESPGFNDHVNACLEALPPKYRAEVTRHSFWSLFRQHHGGISADFWIGKPPVLAVRCDGYIHMKVTQDVWSEIEEYFTNHIDQHLEVVVTISKNPYFEATT